jgi:GTP-binding protein HflX
MKIGRHMEFANSPPKSEVTEVEHCATRTLLVGPYLDDWAAAMRMTGGGRASPEPKRTQAARIHEAIGLASSIALDIVAVELAIVSRIRPATYLGKGKVEELTETVKDSRVDLVFFDCALSAVQQRNLERAFSAKVIDRTGLILEIFGRRAKSKEGTLQVELAHLSYQKSRLVRSWTHLERQRGGFGFLGGPGESQIETDRRLIAERMRSIENELEKVKRTRGLHRERRRAVSYPIVVLVGYTNAGKSTLFNRLTQADVVAADMLFATLDPTLRRVELPHGTDVIVSDTVGFISNLPTMLISAFRATLEEVREADVILHVRDLSHDDMNAQRADVDTVLLELGIDTSNDSRVMEVWNKADLLDKDSLQSTANLVRNKYVVGGPIIVSAVTAQGIEVLLSELETRLAAARIQLEIMLELANGADLSWLYSNTEVMSKTIGSNGTIHMSIRVAPERAEVVRRRFSVT